MDLDEYEARRSAKPKDPEYQPERGETISVEPGINAPQPTPSPHTQAEMTAWLEDDMRSLAPWEVGVSRDPQYADWPCYRIAEMQNSNDQAEVEANRRLIEAAPALARAILVLLPALDEAPCYWAVPCGKREEMRGEPPDPCYRCKALDEALRILSDAMGERGG